MRAPNGVSLKKFLLEVGKGKPWVPLGEYVLAENYFALLKGYEEGSQELTF